MLGTILKVVAGVLVGGATVAAVVGIAGLVYHVVQERITRQNAPALVRRYLDEGNYNVVNVGLTKAEVIDVAHKDGDVYVAIEVDGEKYGLRSSYGTSLCEGEELMV